MPRKQQKPRPLRTCTYCGKTEEPGGERFSRDHVLPKSLFNALDRQMITVLACAACQKEKSYGDDDLRDFVNLHYAGSQHPEAWQQQLKIIQAILEGRSKIGRALMTNRRRHELLSDAGLYLGDVWEAPIPNENRDMFRTLDFIVRGLYRHDVGEMFPADCSVSVAHLDTMKARQVLAPLAKLPHRGPTIKGHAVAWWVSFHPVEDPCSTLWVLLFNDHVWFLGGTGALARYGAEDNRDS
jgi:hypothetical protein